MPGKAQNSLLKEVIASKYHFLFSKNLIFVVSMLKKIYTLGHSTRPIETFIDLLHAHKIQMVVDVRTIPRSRYCPQFSQARLKKSLCKTKIGYCHLKELGGFRHALKDSLNTSWINASFRGFADYMQTSDFWQALKKLEKIAKKKRCALMCSEAVPWRCHRSLISDALTVKYWKVFHIQSRKKAQLHSKTPFLRVKGKHLIYDGIVKKSASRIHGTR
jgi:uncharacterized protein (DUF488 family)